MHSLASRIHPSLKVFLLSLAVADDIGAIVVIALFYTSDLNAVALLVAVGLLGVVAALKALRVIWMPLYVLVGVGVWLATYESGVHATIAGVALGLMTPVHPSLDPSEDTADSLDPDPERLDDEDRRGTCSRARFVPGACEPRSGWRSANSSSTRSIRGRASSWFQSSPW